MILINSHDKKFAGQVERVLTKNGHAVTLAFTGQDCLNAARNLSPELIVLDMYLKNPSGSEVLHSLREQGFKGKIILLAGFSVSPLVPDAMRFGVERVIGEPVTMGSLESAIRSTLGSFVKEEPSNMKHQKINPACQPAAR